MTNYILQQNMVAAEPNQNLSMTGQLNTNTHTRVIQVEQFFGYNLNFFLTAKKTRPISKSGTLQIKKFGPIQFATVKMGALY